MRPPCRALHARWSARLAVASVALTGVVASSAAPAWAGGRARPRFEPTDLELLAPGELGFDLQLGVIRGATASRVELPDLEIDLGLTPRVELDVDLTYAIEGAPNAPLTLDHAAPDNIWISSKLGLLDLPDSESSANAWAFGLQLGPRFPVAPGARGMGFEALLLVGRTQGGVHLVGNVGAIVDPGPEVSRGRPVGAIVALDATLDVDPARGLAVLGELATVVHVSGEPHQLQATAGLQWSASERLDLSLVGMVGVPPGSDAYGALLGASYRFQLWR